MEAPSFSSHVLAPRWEPQAVVHHVFEASRLAPHSHDRSHPPRPHDHHHHHHHHPHHEQHHQQRHQHQHWETRRDEGQEAGFQRTREDESHRHRREEERHERHEQFQRNVASTTPAPPPGALGVPSSGSVPLVPAFDPERLATDQFSRTPSPHSSSRAPLVFGDLVVVVPATGFFPHHWRDGAHTGTAFEATRDERASREEDEADTEDRARAQTQQASASVSTRTSHSKTLPASSFAFDYAPRFSWDEVARPTGSASTLEESWETREESFSCVEETEASALGSAATSASTTRVRRRGGGRSFGIHKWHQSWAWDGDGRDGPAGSSAWVVMTPTGPALSLRPRLTGTLGKIQRWSPWTGVDASAWAYGYGYGYGVEVRSGYGYGYGWGYGYGYGWEWQEEFGGRERAAERLRAVLLQSGVSGLGYGAGVGFGYGYGYGYGYGFEFAYGGMHGVGPYGSGYGAVGCLVGRPTVCGELAFGAAAALGAPMALSAGHTGASLLRLGASLPIALSLPSTAEGDGIPDDVEWNGSSGLPSIRIAGNDAEDVATALMLHRVASGDALRARRSGLADRLRVRFMFAW